MPTLLDKLIAYVTSRADAAEPNRTALRIDGRPATKVSPLVFYVNFLRHFRILPLLAAAFVTVGASGRVAAADAVAAQDLAKASGCFKCHGVDKKKDGPALRDAAAKFKPNADAEDKLVYHVTSGERVKFPDGHEEEHKKVKTNDPKQTKNLVEWILSLEGGTTY
jgi:cytochrome c